MLISQVAPYTLRSTSGEHHAIQGPNSRFPWAAASSGQTATAQSTPEAELAALNTAMKGRGESAMDIWQLLLAPYHQSTPSKFPTYGGRNRWARPVHHGPWKIVVFIHEDNAPAISILRSGMSKTMKTLERGFGIVIGWNHQRIESGDYILIHTRSSHQAADIYTKGISYPTTWELSLIHI